MKTTHAPDLPAQPTPEQAQMFFEKITGEWHLDFSHGQEDLNIDKNGNYFILMTREGQPIATTTRPAFHLELLSCNTAFTSVEIAKVRLNGKTYQIEVLDITEDKMNGYAKHDGHRLTYTRRER